MGKLADEIRGGGGGGIFPLLNLRIYRYRTIRIELNPDLNKVAHTASRYLHNSYHALKLRKKPSRLFCRAMDILDATLSPMSVADPG
jgi:hypothetical protein